MLKTRLITAVIMILALTLAITLLDSEILLLVLASVLLWGMFEWAILAGLKESFFKLCYLILALGIIFVIKDFTHAQRRIFLLGACLWWIYAYILLRRYPHLPSLWHHPLPRAIAGYFVLIPAFSALQELNNQGSLSILFVIFLALVAAVDIGAYFSGRGWGMRALASEVSPNKTLEGALGGVLLSIIVANLIAILVLPALDAYQILRLMLGTFALAVLSIVGDLYESMSKRVAGVKDSGNSLPGHGGVMDRLDSLSAGLPFYALILPWVIGK
jgi:phosphatidate cytidylyltransferase